MKLLEYEAKSILKNSNVPIPLGVVIPTSHSFDTYTTSYPVVVKSQVPVGGRGKAGGVKLIRNQTELTQAIEAISRTPIKGFMPNTLLIEEAIDIDQEFYLSILINRTQASIDLVAHPNGGIEVESQEGFFVRSLEEADFTHIGESLAELYGIEGKSFRLADITESLYKIFVDNDATMLEINPLILTKQGKLIAGDCKMILDDDAAFRHQEWQFEEQPSASNFVILNPQGHVATIANGAGLAMATVDAVVSAGLTPANFLDIGGNATVQGITESFRRIMQFPQVHTIIINIFGGIVRCDDVAAAIIEARKEFPNLPHLEIRLSGTNSDKARELLANVAIPFHDSLDRCIKGVIHG